jgi:hypothetical protein
MTIAGANTDSQNQAILVGSPQVYNVNAPASIAGNQTYLSADILNGTIIHGNAGAVTGTLPTAALLVAALKGILGLQLLVGAMVECLIVNGGTNILTIAAGAGGTFDGNQGGASQIVGVGSSKYVQLRFTNITPGAEAYSICS